MINLRFSNYLARLAAIVISVLILTTAVDGQERIEKKSSGRLCFTNLPIDDSGKSSLKPASGKSKSHSSKAKSKLAVSKSQRLLYSDYVTGAANKYDLDSDLIYAVIRIESNFKKNAKSPKGAMGLMQLMPETAKLMGVKDAYDPKQNIYGGARYLRGLLNRLKDTRLALAAYNAGPEAVVKYNGIPPYRETKSYVSMVMQLYKGPFNLTNNYQVRTSASGTSVFTNLGDN